MRTNIVGTNWAMGHPVALDQLQALRRASNCSITTTVAPRRCTDIEYTSGAAW